MRQLKSITELKQALSAVRADGKTIALVPTMGNLHQGHLSLVGIARQRADIVVASIFVNPTQFGPNEDLDRYPRTLEADLKLLEEMGISAVLAPNTEDVYGKGPNLISLQIEEMDRKLCGAKREGHFNGVLQIVSILFNLTQPDKAYFGEKDFQQLMIIKRMIQELHFPLEAVGCPIVREEDGLAMSSRNRYLNSEERKQALFLSQCLKEIKAKAAEFSFAEDIQSFVQKKLKAYPLVKLDYFEVLEAEDLSEITKIEESKHPHLFVAAYLGKTRLIDNMSLI